MTCAPDVGRPRLARFHNGVVDADWEQDGALLPVLAFERRLHFTTHPRASYGRVREHDEQLVMYADGFINSVPELVANLKVLRCKPAAHAFCLQIRIQPVCELLILCRIA